MSDFDPRWIVFYPAIGGAVFLVLTIGEGRRFYRNPSLGQGAKLFGAALMFVLSIVLTVRFHALY